MVETCTQCMTDATVVLGVGDAWVEVAAVALAAVVAIAGAVIPAVRKRRAAKSAESGGES